MSLLDLLHNASARFRPLLLAALAMACLVALPVPADAAARKCPTHFPKAKTAKQKKKLKKLKARCKRAAGSHGSTTTTNASATPTAAPAAFAPATYAATTSHPPGVDPAVAVQSTGPPAVPTAPPATGGAATPPTDTTTVPAPPTDTTPTGTTPGRLFASDSVWNTALPADAAIDPSSGARMTAFNADIQRQVQATIGPWISERSNSTPFYVVGGDQPKVPVTLDSASVGALRLRSVLAAGVPIPAGAKPAAGVDAHMTIYQPSTDTMWEFWHASQQSDGWHADWGGAMQHVSANPGYYSSSAWAGLDALQGWDWGSTASSLPMMGGVATLAELRSGHIDHALAINIPAPCLGWFSWPAQQTDGTSTDTPNCLLEGAHLRLDPKLDLSKLSLPPVTRMFAEAAQKYGLIVRDRTGAGKDTTFFGEDPTPTGTDPYRGTGGFYGTLTARDVATRFPWKSLQLLKMTACWKAPCLPVGG